MASGALDDLNARVTEVILRAERAPTDSLEAARLYQEISELEEQISSLVPAEQLEGALARVGAVTAALDADDWLRASRLADAYMMGAPDDLTGELKRLQAEADEVARGLAEPDVRPIAFELRAA